MDDTAPLSAEDAEAIAIADEMAVQNLLMEKQAMDERRYRFFYWQINIIDQAQAVLDRGEIEAVVQALQILRAGAQHKLATEYPSVLLSVLLPPPSPEDAGEDTGEECRRDVSGDEVRVWHKAKPLIERK